MKLLLLGSLLGLLTSACSPSDPTHAAVSQYLETRISDPGSYEAVRWGKEMAVSRKGVNGLFNEYQRQRQIAHEVQQHLLRASASRSLSGVEVAKAQYVMGMHHSWADSLQALINKVVASPDSARIGTLLTHTYRYRTYALG
ncbi:MAG: hypothetical protein WKG07_29955 [Hymenobacter sp.]